MSSIILYIFFVCIHKKEKTFVFFAYFFFLSHLLILVLFSISKFNLFFSHLVYYTGKSKVLQYLGNVRHNSTALDTFAKVMKVMNYTGP